MTFDTFLVAVESGERPENASVYVQALWEDARGNWQEAHELVQDLPDKKAALLHAYLHRVEGDQFNAQYWYNRAGEPMPNLSLKEEWTQLVKRFL